MLITAAKAVGARRIRIKTSDGTCYQVDLQPDALPATDGPAEPNDFDVILDEQKKRQRRDEQKP
jgi:hypothetical protein